MHRRRLPTTEIAIRQVHSAFRGSDVRRGPGWRIFYNAGIVKAGCADASYLSAGKRQRALPIEHKPGREFTAT